MIGTDWTEQGEIGEGGDVGGDIQNGPAYERRWVCQPDPGVAEFHVLTFNVYEAVEDPDTTVNARTEPWIQTQVNYAVCTDPEDVGGTEITSDYRYWDGDLRTEESDGPREVCASLGIEDLRAATEQMGR